MTHSIAGIFHKMGFFTRAVIGLVLGTILALLCPNFTIIGMLGTIFMGSLKAIAPLLVLVLVTHSIATAQAGIGKKFGLVIFLYLLSTVLAAALAIVNCYLFPVDIPVKSVEDVSIGSVQTDMYAIFSNMASLIVANPVKSLAEGNYLGILFWSVLFGLALKCFGSPKTLDLMSELTEATSKVIHWIILCVPLGILGIVFNAISQNGLSIFKTYGHLILLLAGTMLVVALVINPLIVAILLRKNPYPLVFRCLRDSGFTAFITRSSAANIPMNIKLCKEMGVQPEFYSVSIPLGSTINMNGAAVTITVMTLSLCHSLGIEVGILSAFVLCLVSVLGACGSSGVASGSLLLVPMACSLFGIGNEVAMQAVAAGFVISIIQDSVETALNSSADALFTIAADKYQYKQTSKKL